MRKVDGRSGKSRRHPNYKIHWKLNDRKLRQRRKAEKHGRLEDHEGRHVAEYR